MDCNINQTWEPQAFYLCLSTNRAALPNKDPDRHSVVQSINSTNYKKFKKCNENVETKN